MKRSELFIKTKKEEPAGEDARNAQLLIKAGFIHKEMAGVYSYLTLGKRVLDNISQIIREEMDAIGGNEVLMSTLQNKQIWESTGRWDDKVVDSWFKTKLANGKELGIGFSHEEPLTNALTQFVSSYKDLPIFPYQIQTKYRNELRAKSGLLRGREFLMKDLYSYSRNQAEHDIFYEKAATAYIKIFNRLGFSESDVFRTFASGGVFSEFSDEFQVLSSVGEDTIYIDKDKKVAVNKEVFNDEVLVRLGLDKSTLVEQRAVEVGNIFSLGSKYAEALNLGFTDEQGHRQKILMGCYGIGVSRVMGLIAEHFADDKGLIWPESVAPVNVYLISLGNESEVLKAAEEMYHKLTHSIGSQPGGLTANGVGVIYDDRDERAGEKFADADLMGIPNRIVISNKTLSQDSLELKTRKTGEIQMIARSKVVDILKQPSNN